MKKTVIIAGAIFTISNLLCFAFNFRLLDVYYYSRNRSFLELKKYPVYEYGFYISEDREYMPESWLKWRYRPGELEQELVRVIRLLEEEGEYINSKYYHFNNSIEPGDELWQFSSNEMQWGGLVGRRGVAIVRDGKIVGGVVTGLN